MDDTRFRLALALAAAAVLAYGLLAAQQPILYALVAAFLVVCATFTRRIITPG
jgi:FtsH-binding integral membrane protein